MGEATLEQLDADVRRLAAAYVHVPPLPMFAEMLRVRDRIYRLLAGRQKPAATARLHLLAGMLCGLLANVSTDLGYRDAAAEQARAAWAYGDIIGHNSLRAWTRGMQALIEYWSGRPQHAVAPGAKRRAFRRFGHGAPCGCTRSRPGRGRCSATPGRPPGAWVALPTPADQ